MSSRLLNSNAISNSGINIGTGAILDKIIEEPAILEDKFIWYFNIQTFIRNFIDCMDGNVKKKSHFFKIYNLDKIVDGIVEDLNIFSENIQDKINLTFYNCQYTLPKRVWENFRQPDDFKGFNYYLARDINKLVRKVAIKGKLSIIDVNYRLPAKDNILITTHIPVDLLPFKSKQNCYLLESFTGKQKDKYLWYTKLHPLGKKDMSIIPFHEPFVFFFGDKFLLKPFSIKDREKVYEIAKNKKWTQLTTLHRCMRDIKDKDRDLYDFFKRKKLLYTY